MRRRAAPRRARATAPPCAARCRARSVTITAPPARRRVTSPSLDFILPSTSATSCGARCSTCSRRVTNSPAGVGCPPSGCATSLARPASTTLSALPELFDGEPERLERVVEERTTSGAVNRSGTSMATLPPRAATRPRRRWCGSDSRRRPPARRADLAAQRQLKRLPRVLLAASELGFAQRLLRLARRGSRLLRLAGVAGPGGRGYPALGGVGAVRCGNRSADENECAGPGGLSHARPPSNRRAHRKPAPIRRERGPGASMRQRATEGVSRNGTGHEARPGHEARRPGHATRLRHEATPGLSIT